MLAQPQIRLAMKRDARCIAELSRDFIEHGLEWTYNRARILTAIANPAINVAVAHESDRLLGFGIMEYADTTAHLVLLGVRPNQQCRGLGKRLVAWLEKSALTAGIGCVSLEARADNPRGIAFYETIGYRERARVYGYYSGLVDAVRLEKRLGADADQ